MLDPTAWDCRLDDDEDAPETWAGYLVAFLILLAPFLLGLAIGRITA